MVKRTHLFILLTTILLGCNGTETGNPSTPGVQPTGGGETGCPTLVAKKQAGDNVDVVVDDVIEDLCQKIISCGVTTTTDTCVNALNGEDGDRMTDEFGLLPANSYTVVDWRNGLNDGSITSDATSLADCRSDINALACTGVTPYVTLSDFSRVEDFIPTACSDAFIVASVAEQQTPSGCP